MFWFIRNRFVGSYCVFRATRRSYFAGGYLKRYADNWRAETVTPHKDLTTCDLQTTRFTGIRHTENLS